MAERRTGRGVVGSGTRARGGRALFAGGAAAAAEKRNKMADLKKTK